MLEVKEDKEEPAEEGGELQLMCPVFQELMTAALGQVLLIGPEDENGRLWFGFGSVGLFAVLWK